MFARRGAGTRFPRRRRRCDNAGVTDLRIGPHQLASPVVLAPMAGVTNVAFRTLCREQERERMGTVAGLYVCEMVTARALVERNEKTMHMTTFADDEDPRSLQLYTTDPEWTYEAAKMIVDENLADHIDMNFGCPVPKVPRRGGGSALPYKRRLFGNIVAAAVRATEGTGIPVTVKFRVGIDDDHHTHLDAGRIAADQGAVAVALHAALFHTLLALQLHSAIVTRSKLRSYEVISQHVVIGRYCTAIHKPAPHILPHSCSLVDAVRRDAFCAAE